MILDTGRSRASREMATAYAGLLGSGLAITLITLPLSPAFSLIGALTLACVPAGAAVMCWVEAGEDAAQAGIILTLSLSTFGLASAILIWTHAWHPKLLLAIAAASMISCLIRLRGRT